MPKIAASTVLQDMMVSSDYYAVKPATKIAPSRNHHHHETVFLSDSKKKQKSGSFQELPKISQIEDAWAPVIKRSPIVKSARRASQNFFMSGSKMSDQNKNFYATSVQLFDDHQFESKQIVSRAAETPKQKKATLT